MILLKDISLIDAQSFQIERGNLLIDSKKNGAYKFINIEETPPETDIIDGTELIATKAFTNAHHHAYSTLARGMPFPSEAPRNFLEILQKIWWNLDKGLTKEMNEISAYYTAISSAKNGVAAVIDHHSSPFAIKGSLALMHNAFNSTGLDSLMCYEISDRDGKEVRNTALNESAQFLDKHAGLVGLHASFTLNNDTLKEAYKIAEEHNTGIHIHLAEDKADQENCLQEHGKRVVERLHDFGFLNLPKSIFAHGLHLSPHEKELLAQSSSYMVQNPESNLNNEVGYFNGQGLGNHIMLGTDGMHSNMIRSAQTAYFTGKNMEDVDIPQIYQRLRNGDQYIKQFYPNTQNALVILENNSPTPIHSENFLGHFFFGWENHAIKHLIHKGVFVLKNKKAVQVDEESINTEARKLAKVLWERL